jgi:pimeloyl-ACP methyl ester carboxylesterase
VLLFGGFDSLIEEFFGVWQVLAAAGFDVVAFDGPGQGGARCLYGQVFDHDWERPVRAILDHLGLEGEVSLVGLSMGGYWALRAAALEPRVAAGWSRGRRSTTGWRRCRGRCPGWCGRWCGGLASCAGASARGMRLAPILMHVVQQTLYIQGESEDLVEGAAVGSSG